MNTCVCTSAIANPKHYLCDACTLLLRKGLYEMARNGPELTTTTNKADVMGTGGGGGTRVHAPELVNDGAMHHKLSIETHLKRWCLALIEHTTTLVADRRVNKDNRLEYVLDAAGEHVMVEGTPVFQRTKLRTITEMALWLCESDQYLRCYDSSPDLLQWVTKANRETMSLIDTRVARVPIGKCSNVVDNEVCDTPLYSMAGASKNRNISCRKCGEGVNVRSQWKANNTRAHDDAIMAPAEISKMMGGVITTVDIARWNNTGKITPVNPEEKRKYKYRFGDVVDYWQGVKTRAVKNK